MAITLRPTERVILNIDFHWSVYIRPSLYFLLFAALAIVLLLVPLYLADVQSLLPYHATIKQFMPFFSGVFVLTGLQPLVSRWLQNHCKQYILTNERFYVEEGVFSKTKRSVPIPAINDVELKQTLMERMLGTGRISVLTGNENHCTIKDINYPDRLRRQLSRLITETLSRTG